MKVQFQNIITLQFLFWSVIAFGQETVSDSISTVDPEKKSSFTTIFYGQPGKAALYSLVLPSAGQIYNRRYWKVPIILGIEGATIWYLNDRIQNFRSLDSCWKSYVESDPLEICTTLEISDVNTAFNQRQNARSQKDFAWLFFGIAHLFNVIEAFVDRHLINFDTSDDLTFQLGPSISTNQFSNQQFSNMVSVDLFKITIPLSK